MSSRLTTRITAGLACAAAVASFASMRFARSVFLSLLEWSGSNPIDQARPTVVALVATRPVFLVSLILAAFAVAVLTEVFVKACENRMAIHAIALLVQVALLASVLWGFFMSFYIPVVRIP